MAYYDPHSNYDPHSKTQQPYRLVAPPQNRNRFVDVHDLGLQELYRQTQDPSLQSSLSFAQIDVDRRKEREYDKPEKEQLTRPERPLSNIVNGISDTYIKFDTRFRQANSNLAQGRIVFDVVALNQNKPIENIIDMQIGDFFIPDIPTISTTPDYFFFKQVIILIEEMSSQAHFGANNARYHFDMRVIPAGIANQLVPAAYGGNASGKFIFTKPFRDITQVTFQFKAPFKGVNFPEPVFAFNAVPGTSPARIVTAQPHGLTIASLVSIFVSDFNSGLGGLDALVNSPDGQVVTVIDATTLEFGPVVTTGFDFTNVLTAIPGSLFIGFRGVRFSMRFRSLVNVTTNTITPV